MMCYRQMIAQIATRDECQEVLIRSQSKSSQQKMFYLNYLPSVHITIRGLWEVKSTLQVPTCFQKFKKTFSFLTTVCYKLTLQIASTDIITDHLSAP